MKTPRFLIILVAAMLAFAAPAWAKDGSNQVDTSLVPDSSFIYETSIYALQTSDTYYEGQTVQVTGEVVGDIIQAEGESAHKWITLDSLPDDQPASVQVYVSAEQASLIDTLGRYEKTGSTVSVTGKYHLVCDQHDGLSDIHATSLSVLQQGSSHHTNFAIEPFVPALALVAAGLLLFMWYRRKREELQ
jgi:hypothetical protein